MDSKSCSKSISVCENSSDVVLEADVKGQTSDSVSEKVLIEEEEYVNKPRQGEENDSRMAKDGVSCSSNISAHAVHEEVVDNVTAVSCNEAESDTSKASDVVLEADVKGQTSDSVSEKVLIEEEEYVNKPRQGEENDSRMAKDGVSCSSNISAHAVHEEVVDNVTAVSCNEAESDTSKAKAKEFHTVDLSGGGERICRICHFGSDQSPEATGDNKSVSPDLIEIGCKCKNELGLAHFHCAEAWFKLRGNSVCEICGCTAKNVTVRLMEDWSGERDNTSDERRRRGRGQSCCIFMVFLLTILLLHWFFKKISGYYQNT